MMEDPLLLSGVPDPTFFNLLDESDQKKYRELRATLRNSDKRYKRNKRLEGLQDALDAIQEFAIRRQPDDWKRSLVCGVCWIGQDIAINIRQLKLLVDKCKSSINGALSKMGYGTASLNSPITPTLLASIPFLKGNFVEQRQWTVRRRLQMSPAPMRIAFPTPVFSSPASFPTPDLPTPIPPFAEESEKNTFSEMDCGKWGFGGEDDDGGYNFITDPCCCCPLEWTRSDRNVDELFKFG
jgi:hypothetical protein